MNVMKSTAEMNPGRLYEQREGGVKHEATRRLPLPLPQLGRVSCATTALMVVVAAVDRRPYPGLAYASYWLHFFPSFSFSVWF